MTRTRTIFLVAAGLLVGFGIGFLWQYARAERLEYELTRAERFATFYRIGMTLGAAALEAHAGSHEAARVLASDFFTDLQDEIAKTPPDVAGEMRAILRERDEVITSLSRGEPASAERLSTLHVRYRMAWQGLEPNHEAHDGTPGRG